MKGLFGFLKATIGGGFFVVLPVVLVWLVTAEAIDLLIGMATGVSEFLVGKGLQTFANPEFVAVLILIAVCFFTGLAMRTRIGLAVGSFIERLILNPIPGYKVFKTLTHSLGGLDETAAFTPALLRDADGDRTPVLVVEEHAGGDATVLVPMAPTPTVGPLRIVSRERIELLDVPLVTFMECYFHFGSGVKDLVRSRSPMSPGPRPAP
jgi:uncharacterized membrane protein